MSRWFLIWFLAALMTAYAAPARAQQTQIDIDPEFAEQVNQLTDNFEAMQNSFVQGQEKISELQAKLAKLKANKELMSDPRVRRALQKLEDAGLSKKLANSKVILSGFEGGAKTIASGTSNAVEKFNEMKGYYDRWNPNSDSPTRPLELVGNSLAELQSIIYKLDPTPDNLLTKPLGEFIGFYKDATQAFVGALNRTKTAIDNRRQNCIGQGCGLGSIAGSKDADFIALGTGDTVRLIRKIAPAIGPVGELWGTGGGTIYMYQISTSGISGSEFVTRTTGQWFTMRCQIGQFNQIYKGMRLAHGEIAAVPTLINRCNQDFSRIAAATQRAEEYWDLLNPSRDDAFCTTKLVSRRGFPGEPKRLLEEANQDRATFIAMYTFKASMRQSVDRLIPAFSGSIFLEGRINLTGEDTVSSGSIAVTLLGRSGSASMGADRRFEMDLPVDADPGRRVGKLRFSAAGFDDYETEVAIDGACADLGTINIALKSESSIDYSQHENALREMRSLAARANSLRQQGMAIASETEGTMNAFDGEIAKLNAAANNLGKTAGQTEAGGANSAATDQLKELERQAFSIAQRMADIRRTMRQKSAEICQSFERIETAFNIQSVDAIYSEVPPAKSTVDGLMAEFRNLLVQLEQLKNRALTVHGGGVSPRAGTNPDSAAIDALEAQTDQVNEQVLRADKRIEELRAIRDQMAGLVSRGQAVLATISALDPAQYGQKGDDLLTQVQVSFGQIDGHSDAVVARSETLDGLVTSRKSSISSIRQTIANARQNMGSRSASATNNEEQSRRDIALNSFNASHGTALIYTDAIEASSSGAKHCNDSALAIYNHRHELDRLAGGDTAAPDPEPEPPVRVTETPQEPEPQPPVEVVDAPTQPPAPEQPPEQQTQVVVTDSDPEPVKPEPADACSTKKVLGLFAKADRALDKGNIGSWSKATRNIASRGCRNGRLEASIARASALVDRKNQERETAERIAAVEGRMPKPPKKPGGGGIGNLLGAIGSVIGAVNSGRGGSSNPSGVGGLLGSILGSGNSRQQQTLPPAQQTRPQENANGTFNRGSSSGGMGALGNGGVVHDPERAGRLAGSIGGASSGGNSNYCQGLLTKIAEYNQIAVGAVKNNNQTIAQVYYKEGRELIKKACKAGCSGIDAKSCQAFSR